MANKLTDIEKRAYLLSKGWSTMWNDNYFVHRQIMHGADLDKCGLDLEGAYQCQLKTEQTVEQQVGSLLAGMNADQVAAAESLSAQLEQNYAHNLTEGCVIMAAAMLLQYSKHLPVDCKDPVLLDFKLRNLNLLIMQDVEKETH